MPWYRSVRCLFVFSSSLITCLVVFDIVTNCLPFLLFVVVIDVMCCDVTCDVELLIKLPTTKIQGRPDGVVPAVLFHRPD